jgi:hypothetical protein
MLQQALARYGLTSLLGWATEAIIQGWSEDQISLELFNRPEFNARFPGIKAREAKGYPPITPEDYLAYEQGISALSTQWGMNISKAQVDMMISNNKSFREAEEVVAITAAAIFEDDSETKSALQRLYPEVTNGDLMSYWMNPKVNLGILQQKYRTSQLAGAGARAGFGDITAAQAQRLLTSGINREQALTGFSQLVQNEELFKAQVGTETDITTDQQIELLAGDAQLGQEVERRRSNRLAEYQGTSTFAAGQEGFAVGSASD